MRRTQLLPLLGALLLAACAPGQEETDEVPVLRLRSPLLAPAGVPVTFDASATTDDHGIVLYRVQFGDGSAETDLSGPIFTHVYEAPASYRIELLALDATGHRLAVRQHARALIPRFAEVYVNCPLPEAMRREAVRSQGHPRGYAVTPGMYQRALLRKRTGQSVPGLGEVVGVDVPFEKDPQAECVLDAMLPVPENTARVLTFLDGWLPGYSGDAA